MKSEAPMRVKEYRTKHGLGSNTMCAILRAMGHPLRARFLKESEVNQWRNDHPEHRTTDIYPAKRKAEVGAAA